ncbi:hypothetical protein CLV59_106261 [Chitinophaga dinghuensis]|uniref:DUF4034 domain-containing protein n=1 Tax=Chitinophaga dinghuensis TaxID=1539050 RepID=A0A327VVD3_9BACT|nr:hypothetical protein [Chitinophaga dinghuensis]RAJ79200.1 hypothetical protein CLV59_106261 [Chitinophaga dinghuensis]
MHISSRKLLIIISGVAASLLFITSSQSCPPDWYRNQEQILLFRQPIAGHDNLEPLYFNADGPAAFDSDPQQNDRKRNCQEWSQYTGNVASWKDVMEVQYAMQPNDFLQAVQDTPQGIFRQNSFLKWLKQPSHKSAMDYMILAKNIEGDAGYLDDPWVDSSAYHGYFGTIMDTIKSRCNANLPTFIRQRYIFQGLKLLSYQIFTNDTLSWPDMHLFGDYYEQELLNKRSIVADWGLLYYGWMPNEKLSQTEAWLKCFARSDEKKNYTLRLLEKAKIKKLLETATDTALRKTAYTVLSIKSPDKGLPYIHGVAAIDPNDQFLPLIICREINKLEDWLLTPELLGFGNSEAQWRTGGFVSKNSIKDLKYLEEVKQELISLYRKSTVHKDLLGLAIAHLCQIDRDYSTADSWLQRVNTKGRPRYIRQKAIAAVLGTMYASNTADPRVQQKIYEQFHLLETMREAPYKDQLINGPMLDLMPQLYLVLSQQLMKHGELVKAGLAFQKARHYGIHVDNYYGWEDSDTITSYASIAWFEKYGSPADIDALIAFNHKLPKTSFEKLINSMNLVDENVLLDVKGTLQVRARQFSAASATFAKIPKNYWENSPFDYYNLCNNIEAVTPLHHIDTNHYSNYKQEDKQAVVDHILRLQKARSEARTAAEKAVAAMQLGNAYYNITYDGKNWGLINWGKSYSEIYANKERSQFWYNTWPLTVRYGNAYYDCSEAARLYREAIFYAVNDPELKAKATIMAALCDEAAHGSYASQEHWRDNYSSPLRKQLKAMFGKTAAYNALQTHCPDAQNWK